ncbi:MAG: class I SAM-dependent methyltransferase [Bacillota bacterium]
MPVYNQIGKTYNTTIDIGAGTGNYSYELAEEGYNVIALEPSEIMRTQGKQHRNIHWKEGIAERIPLKDTSVDGSVKGEWKDHYFHSGP